MIKIKNLIWEAFSDKIKQNVISRWKSQNIKNDDQEKFDYYLDTFSNNISNKIFNNMPKDPIAYTYSTNNRNPGLKKYTFYDLKKIIDDNFSYDEYKGKIAKKTETDSNDIIHDDGTIVIWDSDTREKCIKYGQRGNEYCIAKSDASNMYARYRYEMRLSFYFVLDQSKPDSHPYSFFTIGVKEDANINSEYESNYYVTDRDNHQNSYENWDFITQKCDGLKNLQYLFKPKPLSKYEIDRFNRVNSAYYPEDYIKLNYDDKVFFVQMGKELDEEMFKASNPKIQKLYIETGHSNLEDLDHLFTSDQRKVLQKTLAKKAEAIAKHMGWIQNPDGSYDAKSNVYVSYDIIYNGRLILKFNDIDGNFDATNLRHFDNFPKKVYGQIIVSDFTYKRLPPDLQKTIDDTNESFIQGYMAMKLNWKYNIDTDMYDVDGDVNLTPDVLKLVARNGKLKIKFGTVTGKFNATELDSLVGFPKKVGKNIYIDNKLYNYELSENEKKVIDDINTKFAHTYAKEQNWKYDSKTNSYDVEGPVRENDIKNIAPNRKLLIKFGTVTGGFNGWNLDSFDGFPTKIGKTIEINDWLYTQLNSKQKKFVDDSYVNFARNYANEKGWIYDKKSDTYRVNGNVSLYDVGSISKNRKLVIKFGTITGNFNAITLISYDGFPKNLGGTISINDTLRNKLTPSQLKFIDDHS